MSVFCIKILGSSDRMRKSNQIVGVRSSPNWLYPDKQSCVGAKHCLNFFQPGGRQSAQSLPRGAAGATEPLTRGAEPEAELPRHTVQLWNPSRLRLTMLADQGVVRKVPPAMSSARLKAYPRFKHALVLRTASVHKLLFHYEFIQE